MLRRAADLVGYTLEARDGHAGTAGDFYFDDRTWAVRFLVAHTGSGLADRLVLIPATALQSTRHEDKVIPVDLTTAEIEHSASPERYRPFAQNDPHLRSTYALTGCHIQAEDKEFGHVEDFVIDAGSWVIRYLLIDTRNWWHGKHVLLSPQWVERVNWTDWKVYVALKRDVIEQAPEYTVNTPITRDYEEALYAHYNRDRYW